ncbi:MAG: SAM-dependent methyltransferase [Armatimonadota bacterium]
MPEGPALYKTCDYNAPLSSDAIDWIITALRQSESANIVDLGCGWGQLLGDLVVAFPTITATGFDTDPDLITQAQSIVCSRGIERRATFRVADCTTVTCTADVVICMGSTHAWESLDSALAAFHTLLQQNGKVIVGVPFWENPPSDAACAALGMSPADLPTYESLLSSITVAGFEVQGFRASTLAEWDAFETAWCASRIVWLRDNPTHPDHTRFSDQLIKHRTMWLDGYRKQLGFTVIIASKHA